MKLTDAQIEWTPKEDEGVHRPGIVVHDRAQERSHNRFAYFAKTRYSTMSRWEAIARMMIEFQKVIIRDGLDPQDVHKEFLRIDEYRQCIAPDCEGADLETFRASAQDGTNRDEHDCR